MQTIDRNKIIDRAGKLHALAVRGIDGEKTTAIRKLKEYVNANPEILGSFYPDYSNKRFKKANTKSNADLCDEIEKLHDKILNQVGLYVIMCAAGEVGLLSAISVKMNTPISSKHSLHNEIAVFFNCTHIVFKNLQDTFNKHRAPGNNSTPKHS